MQSPVLVSPSETLTFPECDINDLIFTSTNLVENAKTMLERFYSLSTILQFEIAEERVRPMRERLNMMHVEEAKMNLEDYSESEATAGSGIEDNLNSEFNFIERNTNMTTAQQLSLLTIQICPLLDRIGRVLTDLGGNLDTSENDISVIRPQNNTNPRLNPEIDIHIHAIFADGDPPVARRSNCMGNIF